MYGNSMERAVKYEQVKSSQTHLSRLYIVYIVYISILRGSTPMFSIQRGRGNYWQVYTFLCKKQCLPRLLSVRVFADDAG